ncbi:cytochrome b/b6 domain-containing protein [Desulfobulbus rhabdoformis]|jgi:thiosulfate reductase cytochrome b subunit|uniref:cytochrome b/b6 domain-containing protein n=1 Tax=Desulfobulbus rhabdoformis TaxID=34032 RepID=UPI001964E3AA|nr:cytochrome b/b6 domain-containing protein [Desulfobulbus rhabdoformis]MBM9616472.1 cytochrome b/b6 domain-containing protein [Desulfobulbus rhabdoformis]
MSSKENMLYVHPVPVRLWHWINASGFIVLIGTGFQIRYAESIHLMSLNHAITLHNYIGLIVVANYFIWLGFYFSTGKIRIYVPDFPRLIPQIITQVRYYGYGIFKGDPNPHAMTSQNKFNPLQQQAYLAIMIFILPAQIITGIFLWRIAGYEEYINLLGGIKIIDTVHVLLFFFFISFIIVHCYLSTLGSSMLAHFKAMVTGYEEHH